MDKIIVFLEVVRVGFPEEMADRRCRHAARYRNNLMGKNQRQNNVINYRLLACQRHQQQREFVSFFQRVFISDDHSN